jgi:hypothetical protein
LSRPLIAEKSKGLAPAKPAAGLAPAKPAAGPGVGLEDVSSLTFWVGLEDVSSLTFLFSAEPALSSKKT